MAVPLTPPAVVTIALVVRLTLKSSSSRPRSSAQHSSVLLDWFLMVQPPVRQQTGEKLRQALPFQKGKTALMQDWVSDGKNMKLCWDKWLYFIYPEHLHEGKNCNLYILTCRLFPQINKTCGVTECQDATPDKEKAAHAISHAVIFK